MRDLETNEPYLIDGHQKRVSPESQGWHKKIAKWTMVLGKQKIFSPIVGRPTSFQVTEAYILRVYSVSAGVCSHCERLGFEMDRIRNMSIKTGLYRKCFLGIYGVHGNADFTSQFQDYGNEYSRKPQFKLLEERITDLAEIIQLVKENKLDFIADWSIIDLLEKHFGVTY